MNAGRLSLPAEDEQRWIRRARCLLWSVTREDASFDVDENLRGVFCLHWCFLDGRKTAVARLHAGREISAVCNIDK